MSHFSSIKTKITDKPQLIEALELLLYNVEENKYLKVSGVHSKNHPTVKAEVAISKYIGFKWNGETYDLVADKQTWDLDVPVERFIDKITQQYARLTIHNTVKELGYQVEEEWEMDDNSIELTVTNWN